MHSLKLSYLLYLLINLVASILDSRTTDFGYGLESAGFDAP